MSNTVVLKSINIGDFSSPDLQLSDTLGLMTNVVLYCPRSFFFFLIIETITIVGVHFLS